MKSQANKINFKKNTIIELNTNQLKTVVGGTQTIVPLSFPETSTKDCQTNNNPIFSA